MINHNVTATEKRYVTR